VGITFDNNDFGNYAWGKIVFDPSPEWDNFIYNNAKKYGVLVIKLTGDYYQGSNPAYIASAPNEMYLLWNSAQNAALEVPKTGGGTWSYPLSETDYLGDFRADLNSFLGPNTAIGPLASLFARAKIVSGITKISPISGFIMPGNNTLAQSSVKVISNQRYMDGGSPDDYASGATEAEAIANLGSNTTYLSPSGYELPNGSAANQGGSTDVWTNSVARLLSETYTTNVSTESYSEDLWYAAMEAPMRVDFEVSGSRSFSFTAPIGGVNDPNAYPGYLASVGTQVPPPVLSYSLLLTSLIGGGAVAFGPAVTYSGVADFRSGWASVYSSKSVHYSETVFSDTRSGFGTLTFQSGAIATIAADFEEAGAVTNPDATSGNNWWSKPFYWPSYSPESQVDYALAHSHAADGFAAGDDVQALIVIETQESGRVKVTLSAPPEPYYYNKGGGHWVYASPVESAAEVSNRTVNYFIPRCLCAIVPDATKNNPWSLPENSVLKAAIYSLIADFQTANPLTAAADRWIIQPELQLLTW
jgi:hypothetical protein